MRGHIAGGAAAVTLIVALLLVPLCAAAAAVEPAVSGGGFHSAIVRSDGTLWTTGLNTDGPLGNGTVTPANVFTQVDQGFLMRGFWSSEDAADVPSTNAVETRVAPADIRT